MKIKKLNNLKLRTKIEACVAVILLLSLTVASVIAVTRTISDTQDNINTFIRNSEGNYWEVDGNADNIQLQASIDDLPVTGGKVSWPRYNYDIDAQILLSGLSNVTVEGLGRSSNLILGTTDITTNAMLSIQSCSNITIHDLCITGSKFGALQGCYYNIGITDSTYIYLDGIACFTAWDDNIYFHNSSFCYVTNIKGFDAHDEGQGVSNVNAIVELEDGSHNITVDSVFGSGCKQVVSAHNHATKNAVRNVLFSNLNGKNCDNLVFFETYAGGISQTGGIDVTGGVLYANESAANDRACTLSNVSNIWIEGLVVHNTRLWTGENLVTNITFENCDVFDDDGSITLGCVYVPHTLSSPPSYIDFINVDVYIGSNAHGFNIRSGNHMYFERCDVFGGDIGFHIYPTSTMYDYDFINCKTLNTDTEGMELHDIDNYRIDGCTIVDPAQSGANDGIKFYDCHNGTVTTTFIKKVSTGTLRYGLVFQTFCSNITVFENIFKGYTTDGIYVVASYRDFFINDNIGYEQKMMPLSAPTVAFNGSFYANTGNQTIACYISGVWYYFNHL